MDGELVQNDKRRAVRLAREHGCEWMTCSAATGEGVQEVFMQAVRMAVFHKLNEELHKRVQQMPQQDKTNKCHIM